MNLILRQVLGYQQGLKRASFGANPKLTQELKDTQKQLNSILTKWKFGEQPLRTSEEFLNKFEPWIDNQLESQKNLKLFLAKKGVNNLTEAETKLTNRDLSEQEELNQLREELAHTQQLWTNTEQDYLNQIQTLKASQEVPEDYQTLIAENQALKEQLETLQKPDDWETQNAQLIKDLEKEKQELEIEKDKLARDKQTLEQETLSLNNRLKNKSQELSNKDQAIERLKKEKSSSEIALNKTITELKKDQEKLKKKYSKQSQLLDTEQLECKKLEEKIEQLEEEIRKLQEGRT